MILWTEKAPIHKIVECGFFLSLGVTDNVSFKFIVKYVDDIFAIIKREDENIILKTLNNYHNKLQFTIEHEQNDSIAFLDIKIYKLDNKLITNWYSKPTSSGRMINYLSTQPHNQKLNTAFNFINKVLTTSHDTFLDNNIKKIRNTLMKNNYPTYIINNLLDKFYHKKQNTIYPPLDSQTSDNAQFFSITFIPTLTDSNKLKEIIDSERVKFAHKPNFTLRSVFTQKKDRIEKEQQHDVVYEITCKGNDREQCNRIYIGTTKRTLATRVGEHKKDIAKNKQATALAQHSTELEHVPDFDNIRILDKEKKLSTRFTLESLRIQQKLTKTINTKEDVDNISSAYITAI